MMLYLQVSWNIWSDFLQKFILLKSDWNVWDIELYKHIWQSSVRIDGITDMSRKLKNPAAVRNTGS